MNEERRRYFRIGDQAAVSMKLLAANEVESNLSNFWENEHCCSIRNNYNLQIERHIADFHKIESGMPELARYLRVLEKQVERITEKLIGADFNLSLVQKSANISAQGIAFNCDQAPDLDSLVELNLKLLPSGFRLVIIARVVLVETEIGHAEGANKVSLDFEHLHEADREILIKHIHGKQMESLSIAQV